MATSLATYETKPYDLWGNYSDLKETFTQKCFIISLIVF